MKSQAVSHSDEPPQKTVVYTDHNMITVVVDSIDLNWFERKETWNKLQLLSVRDVRLCQG